MSDTVRTYPVLTKNVSAFLTKVSLKYGRKHGLVLHFALNSSVHPGMLTASSICEASVSLSFCERRIGDFCVNQEA